MVVALPRGELHVSPKVLHLSEESQISFIGAYSVFTAMESPDGNVLDH